MTYRVAKIRVQAIRELGNASSNFVKVNRLLAPVTL